MLKTWIISLCLLLGCLGSVHALSVDSCVSYAYLSQVGIREQTGKNDGVAVEKYLQSVGLKKGYAWCAAFVNWCLSNCEVETAKSAWCPNWFPSSKVIYSQSKTDIVPKSGDVFGIYFADKKRIAHVGFIHHWGESSYCITVEGNTNDYGSREGDGVYSKRRLKKQIYKVARWTR